MSDITVDSSAKHRAFLSSPRQHVLMITNHGIHQWRIVPGLPDTGGQNVFVNRFTGELARLGFKITIVNRGGYRHPVTGDWQRGLRYKDEHQRILYLEDGEETFIRKEDMMDQIPRLVESLKKALGDEGTGTDLILSHYWDGAEIGVLCNRALPERVKHIWTPHSLGALKKRNVSPDQYEDLRIDERITIERELIGGEALDGVAATSSTVRQALIEDYAYTGEIYFLPPCVDTERFSPQEIADDDGIWDFLSERCGISSEEIRRSRIITEISRTDTTKRKDVLIKAFATVQRRVPDSMLIVSIDESERDLAEELRDVIRTCDAETQDRVAVVGSVWEQLPDIYAVTSVYCTPSVMEGFGMSAQEAAATGVPVVASHLVPFATEYLLGQDVERREPGGEEGGQPVKVGEGAVVVQADDVSGFAYALEILLTDDDLCRRMGERAYHITVPYFTWQSRVPAFLDEIGVSFEEVEVESDESAD